MRFLMLSTAMAASLLAADVPLPPACTLPPALSKSDSFASCGITGASSSGPIQANTPKGREDQQKNNFCADMSHPVSIDVKILRDMQASVDAMVHQKFPTLKPAEGTQALLKSSRAPLTTINVDGKQLGEGKVVRIVVLMKDAHVSDCSSTEHGEDVNCSLRGVQNNDFHMPLMDPAIPGDTDECNSVTAEISPHFRPAAWAKIDLLTPTSIPVRITGPLFFDDSHTVCTKNPTTGKMSGSPPRSSVWEIHPVYQLEVCSSTLFTKCDVNSIDTAVWTPYSTWINTHAKNTTASGKAKRDACPAQ
jgi:hypothetical protein